MYLKWFFVYFLQVCCCSTSASMLCPTADELETDSVFPPLSSLWVSSCIYCSGFLNASEILRKLTGHVWPLNETLSMWYPPKLWKDPKSQQDWAENQSGFTTKDKQSARNTKLIKYIVKNNTTFPPNLHSLIYFCTYAWLHFCFTFLY